MDKQDHLPQEDSLEQTSTSTRTEFSTTRRISTSLLVLLAALLLGYVLYDLFSGNSRGNEPQVTDTVINQGSEYAEDDKQVILESMSSLDGQTAIHAQDENDRQILIDAMNSDAQVGSDMSEEDRIKLLNQME
jgi:hypothetical protein